jgi:GNAT superfamily N-acetyltransferase
MRSQLLRRYDSELRVNPPPRVGVTFEHADGVLRARGSANWIFTRDLDAANLDSVVVREADLFRRFSEDVEWKVYGHEAAIDLPACLAAHGFEPDETETLMFLDLATWRPSFAAPEGIRIRRVADQQGLHDLMTVMSEAFGRNPDDQRSLFDELKATCLTANPIVFAYVAYADKAPVGAGRMESAPGYAFASIWSGCTIPAYRHRGIFRALVAVRIDEARRRAHAYMAVDAADTSRPILERLGFFPITTVTGWKLRARQETPDPAC